MRLPFPWQPLCARSLTAAAVALIVFGSKTQLCYNIAIDDANLLGELPVNACIETIAVIAISTAGIYLGRRASHLSGCRWLLVYAFPLLILAALLIGRFGHSICEVPFLTQIAASRVKFVLTSLAVTMGLIMPLPLLPRRWERIAVTAIMVVLLAWFTVLPFIMPAFIEHRLEKLQTRITADGLCLQSTAYTCAPAAAVTALNRLGIKAEEGRLAIRARTTPVTGTLPQSLSLAMRDLYASRGLTCRYRQFHSIADLEDAGLTLAVVKDSLLNDQCVTILDISHEAVTVADPAIGKIAIPRDRFELMWRHSGIVLARTTSDL